MQGSQAYRINANPPVKQGTLNTGAIVITGLTPNTDYEIGPIFRKVDTNGDYLEQPSTALLSGTFNAGAAS